MSNRIVEFFFPKRKLHLIPKHVSAQYARGEITKEQAILMMAGYARDPQEAQNVYNELKAKHGNDMWNHVKFDARRKRSTTFRGQLLKLLQRIFGENERPNLRERRKEAIVYMDYGFDDE